jgi:hypothetical protein
LSYFLKDFWCGFSSWHDGITYGFFQTLHHPGSGSTCNCANRRPQSDVGESNLTRIIVPMRPTWIELNHPNYSWTWPTKQISTTFVIHADALRQTVPRACNPINRGTTK